FPAEGVTQIKGVSSSLKIWIKSLCLLASRSISKACCLPSSMIRITGPDCSPADLIGTLQTSSSSGSPNTSSGPRPYSCLQPCWPSACSCWVCSPQWHLPAVSKVWGTFSPGCRVLLLWLCSWSWLQSSSLSTTSGARKSRSLVAWS
ncbi:hypothetical protein LEMLEM_LOCUS5017, partial [Lemmus lemmus]